MKKYITAVFGIFLSIGYAYTAHAESHSDYVDECESKLNVNEIPGFHCINDGISISSSTGLALPTSNNYLGRVTFNNPDVDGVFLCRSVTGSGSSAKYARAGYIIQNRENGSTCFFDGKFAPGGSVNDINNTVGTVDGGTQSANNWMPVDQMDGQCVDCHTADPFIVTPGLSEAFRDLGLIGNGRNTKGNYHVVGAGDPNSFFFEWNDDKYALVDHNADPGCTGCHDVTLNNGTLSTINSLAVSHMASSSNFTGPSNQSIGTLGEGYYQNFEFPAYVPGQYYRIENHWTSDAYIHIENGQPEASSISSSWFSAQWRLYSSQDDGVYFYRIQNRWTNEYLYIDSSGNLDIAPLSQISNGDDARWRIAMSSGGFNSQGSYTIQNKGTNDFLNVLYGILISWGNSSNSNSHWYITPI